MLDAREFFGPIRVVASNLRLYTEFVGTSLDQDDLVALERFVRAAVPSDIVKGIQCGEAIILPPRTQPRW